MICGHHWSLSVPNEFQAPKSPQRSWGNLPGTLRPQGAITCGPMRPVPMTQFRWREFFLRETQRKLAWIPSSKSLVDGGIIDFSGKARNIFFFFGPGNQTHDLGLTRQGCAAELHSLSAHNYISVRTTFLLLPLFLFFFSFLFFFIQSIQSICLLEVLCLPLRRAEVHFITGNQCLSSGKANQELQDF